MPSSQRNHAARPGNSRPRNINSSEIGAHTTASTMAPSFAQRSPANTSTMGCDGKSPVSFMIHEAAIMPNTSNGNAASQPSTPAPISRSHPCPRCNPTASRHNGRCMPRTNGHVMPMNSATSAGPYPAQRESFIGTKCSSQGRNKNSAR